MFVEGMQKDDNVKIKPHSGATKRDIIDHLKLGIRIKPDYIVIHVETNDVTGKTLWIHQEIVTP